MKLQICVVDYGVGNTHSILNALAALGHSRVRVSKLPSDLAKADVLILPGVGAFEEAMRCLRAERLDLVLTDLVMGSRKPILGICLGMQILATTSEENGMHEGLNWIPGHVRRIPSGPEHPVPHVGWNSVNHQNEVPAFNRLAQGSHFYFDHSYHYECAPEYVAAVSQYGGAITVAVHSGNVTGVQFHPEKSQNNGLRLFRGFLNSIR
jgi:imidazole glycerol-phosphate synthase subunit HisH